MQNHPRAIFSIKVSRAETKLDFIPGCEKSDQLTYRVGVSSVQKVSPALDKLVQYFESLRLVAEPLVGPGVGEGHRAETKPADFQPGVSKK